MYIPTIWDQNTTRTTERLNNFETVFDEFMTVFQAHHHADSFYTRDEMHETFWYAGNDGHDSGADADLIHHSSGNIHASSFSGMGAPTGLIIGWAGTINDIPVSEGWALCNGENGTRDLRNLFIVGAGNNYLVGQTGGDSTFTAIGTLTIAEHQLALVELPPHTHTLSDHWSNNTVAEATGVSYAGPLAYATRNTDPAGGNSPHDHPETPVMSEAVVSLPLFYSLSLIQKIEV